MIQQHRVSRSSVWQTPEMSPKLYANTAASLAHLKYQKTSDAECEALKSRLRDLTSQGNEQIRRYSLRRHQMGSW